MPRERKLKILLISDKPDWSYSTIVHYIKAYNTGPVILHHISCKGNVHKISQRKDKYDLFFVIGWQNTKALSFLDKSRTITGIHSHQSFDNRKTTISRDVYPSNRVVEYLSQFKAINVVSERLHRIFDESGLETEYTPNGVDTDKFAFKSCLGKKFVVGSVGSLKNDWNKGISKIIKKASKQLKVTTDFAILETGRIKSHNMNKYYDGVLCYICASQAEGMPLSVLEAASSGCVMLSTPCGDIPKLIDDGQNGLLIDRSLEDVIDKITLLRQNPNMCDMLSRNVRKEVVSHWDWKVRSRVWLEFIYKNLN